MKKDSHLKYQKGTEDLYTHSVKELCELLYTNDGTKKKPSDLDEKLKTLKAAFAEGRTYVASQNETIIGYISWEYSPKDHKYVPDAVFLSELYVLPEYRKSGIGTKLVQLSLKDKDAHEYSSNFWVTHDPEETFLSQFYERLGFSEKGKTDAGNIIMTLDRES